MTPLPCGFVVRSKFIYGTWSSQDSFPAGDEHPPNLLLLLYQGVPGGSAVKDPPAKAEDTGSIPGSGRYPGEGHGYPLQSSCLENPMDRGARRATVHGVTKSQT